MPAVASGGAGEFRRAVGAVCPLRASGHWTAAVYCPGCRRVANGSGPKKKARLIPTSSAVGGRSTCAMPTPILGEGYCGNCTPTLQRPELSFLRAVCLYRSLRKLHHHPPVFPFQWNGSLVRVEPPSTALCKSFRLNMTIPVPWSRLISPIICRIRVILPFSVNSESVCHGFRRMTDLW